MPVTQIANQQPGVVGVDPSLRPVMRVLTIPLVLFCLILLSVTTVLFNLLQNYTVAQRAETSLADLEYRMWRAIESHRETLISIEKLVSEQAELKAMLMARDRRGLLIALQPYYHDLNNRLGVSHFYLHDPDMVNVVRLHWPERYGDQIQRQTALDAHLLGETVTGMELGGMGTYTLRVVTPVRHQGEVLGYVELGTEVEDIAARATVGEQVRWVAFIYKKLIAETDWQAGADMLNRQYDWHTF